MMNPLCPFCAEPTEHVSDNPRYEAWGCKACGVYINRRKPEPKGEGLTALANIAAPKVEVKP